MFVSERGHRLSVSDGAVTAVETDQGLCVPTRSWWPPAASPRCSLRPLGIDLPICPVKGISVTVPSAPWKTAITTPTIDDENLFGLVPMGDRTARHGSAEITGYDATVTSVRAGRHDHARDQDISRLRRLL
jgi:D-amino-acid dehydrogenase